MSTIELELNNAMQQKFESLKAYYNLHSNADLIRRAITLLGVAKEIEENNGELIHKQGNRIGRVNVR